MSGQEKSKLTRGYFFLPVPVSTGCVTSHKPLMQSNWEGRHVAQQLLSKLYHYFSWGPNFPCCIRFTVTWCIFFPPFFLISLCLLILSQHPALATKKSLHKPITTGQQQVDCPAPTKAARQRVAASQCGYSPAHRDGRPRQPLSSAASPSTPEQLTLHAWEEASHTCLCFTARTDDLKMVEIRVKQKIKP